MRKKFLSILLTLCMVLALMPGYTITALAAYSPTIYMKLDGQPISPSSISTNFTGLTAYNPDTNKSFDFTEGPVGTYTQSNLTDGTYELSLFNQTGDSGLHQLLGNHYLADQSPFTISNTTSYPLTLAFYTVSYKPGTYGKETTYKLNYIAAEGRGQKAYPNYLFTRDGYKQIGWSTDANGAVKTYDKNSVIYPTSAMTLYPAWGVLRAVTIIDGEGVSSTKTSASGSVTGSITSGTSAVEGETVTITPGTPATGYKLSAVKYNDGTEHVLTQSGGKYSFTMPALAVTISSEYVSNTFAVTYNPGSNGTGSQQSATKTGGIALTLKSAIFTREGYGQTGWAITDGGTKAYELGGSYTTDAAKDFYPVWTANTYSISYTLNGGTVSTSNPANYTVESAAITLNTPSRSGCSFLGWTGSNSTTAQANVSIPTGSTGNKNYTANWKADKPAAPDASIVTAKTDTSVTITTQSGYEYSVNGTDWYSGTGSYTFTDLTPNTAYNLVSRKAAITDLGSVSAASDASEALVVTTKNVAPTMPTASISSLAWNSVTMSAVAGGEYSKDGGATWQDSNIFTNLSAATKYNFAVRIKETSTTVASAISTIVAQYTAAATPPAGEGYTINYSTETISIASGYEICSDSSFASDKLLSNGGVVTAGTTYYVRKNADTTTTPNTPASESVSFMVSTRPVAPTATAYSYDYENEQIVFASQYEVYTAISGGSVVTSDSTVITPGSTLYIRMKSTASTLASDWTTITVPARPAITGLSISVSRTDKTVTVAAITGAEYSKDGGATWQSSNSFTGLNPNEDYDINIRYAATASSFASTPLGSVTIKTKTSAGDAPSEPLVSTQTDNLITINAVSGCQYAITTSDTEPTTWEATETTTGTKTFAELSAATRYYIWVRTAENDTAMPSNADRVSVYTAAATPSAGEGYAINYSAETISITSGYEISSDSSFASDKLVSNGTVVTAGATYYIRKKADTTTTPNIPASAYVSFTVSARPTPPTDTAYFYDYENEQIVFASQYEVYTATSGGSAVTSDSTVITPGSTLYIRTKSTDSALASDWTTITVPARPATTGLSISVSKTDKTITVAAITGAEYSKDGGTTWQSSNVFTGLNPNTDYAINIRYAATASDFASMPLGSVTIKTKTSAGEAPSEPSVSTQTDNAITINTVSGCQYAITTNDTEPTTWESAETTTGTKTFAGLSAATRYYIWVRTAENDTTMPSEASRISVYTAAAAPSGDVYTIDYNAETISYDSMYEITADKSASPLTIIGNGDSLTSNISDYNMAAKKIYVRVKAVTNGAPAGAWMESTIQTRPETPSASALNETVSNKNDGKISGVTESMEWKAAGGTYTPVTADQALNGITGLADGTYYLRHMAVSGTGFKSGEQEITITAGQPITVTFNSTSGSAIGAITGKVYGDSITAPEKPSRSGFYFAGWYKEPACTNAWTFDLDTLTDDITLYAKWSAIPTYTVTGKIVDDTSHAVDGATVRMMQGTTQFGTMGVADSNGDFMINNVPPGIYNLVITKGTKTAIVKVQVSSGNVAIGNATLPSGNANSILVVNGSDTPNVVVGELDREANAQLADSSNPHADKVDITLTVQKKDASTATNGSDVTSAITAAGKQVGMILSIEVKKTVNGTEDNSYNQTNGLLEINIPLPVELQGKASYEIYRYHGTSVDTITENPNSDLEKIVVDRTNWTMTLLAKKFSTYAIGYTNPSSGGGGGSGSAIIPNPGTKENVALPYYVENGKEIMVGFASNASGTMKYIVPKDVKVLFRENPKKFNDITGHWAKDNIDFVTQRELFLGTENGNFSPQLGMTRAMFATVIGRLYERSYGNLTPIDGQQFTDVDKNAYYATYIDWASENNIITGIGSGLFKPDQQITRQEMAAILYRFAEFLNVLPAGSKTTQLNYPDATQISSWATEGAMYCQQTQIITGRLGGNFVPQGTATRAEVAAILQRFIENSVK